jgi:hypothetical protein
VTKQRVSKGYRHRSGYRMIHVNGKRMLEHRAVMEKKLGRPLFPGETVHHKGRKDDNRDHMLELRVAGHPHSYTVEEVVAWAAEMLDRYAPEMLTTHEGLESPRASE